MDPRPLDDPNGAWPGFDDSPLLDPDQLKKFQSVAALLNFISMDRPELLFSVKELMRRMSCASCMDLISLKRVVRFIRTMPRVIARYPWQKLSDHIEVYADSDHAGCPRTRRSTLGGSILWGGANL